MTKLVKHSGQTMQNAAAKRTSAPGPKQIRRRTRVAAIFPNPESCLRLVSAILMEISEAWETSAAYLNPTLLK